MNGNTTFGTTLISTQGRSALEEAPPPQSSLISKIPLENFCVVDPRSRFRRSNLAESMLFPVSKYCTIVQLSSVFLGEAVGGLQLGTAASPLQQPTLSITDKDLGKLVMSSSLHSYRSPSL